MPKTKFNASRMLILLQQLKRNISIHDICKQEGISQATFYNWKKMLEAQQLKEANEKLLKQIHKGGKQKKTKSSRQAKTKPDQQDIQEVPTSLGVEEMKFLDTLSSIIASIILKEEFGMSDEEITERIRKGEESGT